MWGCTCCWICYRHSVILTFGSVFQALYMFFSPSPSASSLPVFLLAHILFQTALVWSLNFWSTFSSAHRWALDIFDIVSNLYSVPVNSGLDAVVYNDTQPSLLTPFISMCVLPLCRSSLAVKGSLSSSIKAGCQSRQRRPKDNAHYLWWVVNMTVHLQRLIGSNLQQCKADLSPVPLDWKLKAQSALCSLFTMIESDADVCFSCFVRIWEAVIYEKMSTSLYTS